MAAELIRVEGLREIAIAARKLTDEVKRKIAFDGLTAGARIVRNAARGLAPVLKRPDPRRRPGTLRNAIVAARVRRGDFPEEVKVIVGVRFLSKRAVAKFKAGNPGKSGAENPNDPFYADMVELGTKAHRKRGKGTPRVQYLKRGFEPNASAAANKIRDISRRGILRYGNSLAK